MRDWLGMMELLPVDSDRGTGYRLQTDNIAHVWKEAGSQDCQNEEADRSSAPPLPSRPVPLEVDPLNPARGFGKRCKLPQRRLGRSPSRHRFWCILALKSGIWWQQFL